MIAVSEIRLIFIVAIFFVFFWLMVLLVVQ